MTQYRNSPSTEAWARRQAHRHCERALAAQKKTSVERHALMLEELATHQMVIDQLRADLQRYEGAALTARGCAHLLREACHPDLRRPEIRERIQEVIAMLDDIGAPPTGNRLQIVDGSANQAGNTIAPSSGEGQGEA